VLLLVQIRYILLKNQQVLNYLVKQAYCILCFWLVLKLTCKSTNKTEAKVWYLERSLFLFPITIGYLVCVYVFGFSLWPALLLASMFSTHTLLSYPIVSNMGIVKNRAVQISFGGTIITDSAVLNFIRVITNVVGGEINSMFWIRLIVSLGLLVFRFYIYCQK
jgi:Kef-type K+ transport system membrane component KefB